jgi:thiol-disulfide isomerase/thioredoxin
MESLGALLSYAAAHPSLVVFLLAAAVFVVPSLFPAAPAPKRSTPSRVAHPVGGAAYAAELRGAAADQLVLVDFYATWCGPCVAIAPFIEELADANPHVKVVKVQEDESRDVLAAEAIRAFPTFRFYVAGRCVGEVVGADRRRLADDVARLSAAAKRGESLPEVARPAGGAGGGCSVA